MYGLMLIAVLAIMGGIIAYIGDNLGSKVGKRKLTIFGLRPKHTSILVTIVTGILIAASTLGVLTLVSQDVKTALFGMAALKDQLSTLTQEVSAKTTELDTNRMALEAKTKEYTALTAKINETTADLAKITTELSGVLAERDRTAAALEVVQSEFAQARGDLDKSRQEIETLQATKDELDARVAVLNDNKTQLQNDVGRLNELTANLRKGIQIVREGVVVYRAGEALSTAVVKGGQPASETGQALAEIISATNQAILEKLGVADKKTEVLWIAQAGFEQAVSLITATPGEVIVRISSVGNIVYGEPVIGQLELYPSRLVYSTGDVVLSQVVDAGTNAIQARETVLTFLQKVNGQAISRGMLPDPLQGTVGVMDIFQLTDTVNKVKHYGGKVELTAVTKKDIYTAGPLQIEIRVHSVN